MGAHTPDAFVDASAALDGSGDDAELPREDAAPRDAGVDGALDAGAQPVDASPDGTYLGADDASMCAAAELVEDGCEVLSHASEGAAGRCDGYDNDCDGLVDEGCPCQPGVVQDCFLGPPGRADTGSCNHGSQRCEYTGEFPALGPCEGGQSPVAEVCDGLDNDCNGCPDDIEACAPVLDCPGPGDPRIPSAKPFSSISLDATQFYAGPDAVGYRWRVEGSPCDKLFQGIPGSRATAENGQLSFQLSLAHTATPQLRFTLSGTYVVQLEITLKSGEMLGCSFPIQVAAEGLRIELCWDKTGPTSASKPVDLDLHLGLRGASSAWAAASDFYYETFSPPLAATGRGLWNHPNTPLANCKTGGLLDQVHEIRGNCINPRLDQDNQDETSRYVAENVNLDNPRAGEVFQVAVNHKSEFPARTGALVNVYCGGKLRGSFELDAAQTTFSDEIGDQELWRVAQIAVAVGSDGKVQDCTPRALTAPSGDGSPLVTVGDFSMNWLD